MELGLAWSHLIGGCVDRDRRLHSHHCVPRHGAFLFFHDGVNEMAFGTRRSILLVDCSAHEHSCDGILHQTSNEGEDETSNQHSQNTHVDTLPQGQRPKRRKHNQQKQPQQSVVCNPSAESKHDEMNGGVHISARVSVSSITGDDIHKGEHWSTKLIGGSGPHNQPHAQREEQRSEIDHDGGRELIRDSVSKVFG